MKMKIENTQNKNKIIQIYFKIHKNGQNEIFKNIYLNVL